MTGNVTGNVKKILIIGGGFSGMTAALRFAEQGQQVELLEIDADWRSYGAGISLHGATLRVIKQLGLIDAFLAQGAASDGVEMRGPDDAVLFTMPTPRVAGPEVPGGAGILRPALARVLSDAVRRHNVKLRLGQSFTRIEESGDQVHVTFDDGTRDSYDLVVGADGVYSSVRKAVFADAPVPKFIGQSVWRAVLPRPEGINTVAMWMGPRLKAGMNVVNDDQVYLFLTEDRATNEFVPAETQLEALRALLRRFASPILQQAATDLHEGSQINYRPLEQLLLPRPWYRGRVVLIGDAVHATTPHLAAGACIGIEDGVVLAQAIAEASTIPEALNAYEARRWERCRMVVENSGKLAEIEVSGGDRAAHAAIMKESMIALAQPI
jgi:2-polyprenyl-6-methoxyphenol hydroxylase-like FAD-dependent oxidoreductase